MGNFIQLGFNENKKAPNTLDGDYRGWEVIHGGIIYRETSVCNGASLVTVFLKPWPNGFASRRKFWTCVQFAFNFAWPPTCVDLHRRLALTLVELKFGRK